MSRTFVEEKQSGFELLLVVVDSRHLSMVLRIFSQIVQVRSTYDSDNVLFQNAAISLIDALLISLLISDSFDDRDVIKTVNIVSQFNS